MTELERLGVTREAFTEWLKERPNECFPCTTWQCPIAAFLTNHFSLFEGLTMREREDLVRNTESGFYYLYVNRSGIYIRNKFYEPPTWMHWFISTYDEIRTESKSDDDMTGALALYILRLYELTEEKKHASENERKT